MGIYVHFSARLSMDSGTCQHIELPLKNLLRMM